MEVRQSFGELPRLTERIPYPEIPMSITTRIGVKKLCMQYILGILLAFATAIPATAQTTLAGTWKGILTFPEQTRHFVLHVSGTDNNLSATADSPDQNIYGGQVDSITLNGQILRFTMTQWDVKFTGTLSSGSISGTLTQRETSVPLSLVRSK
jgi:hypothetical protein